MCRWSYFATWESMLMQAAIVWFDLAVSSWSASLATRMHAHTHTQKGVSRWPFCLCGIFLDMLFFFCKCHFSCADTTWLQKCPSLTCGTEGDECLHMLANECQLILRQRQPPHNVLNEVVRRYCCQVPLQLSQHHQFPFLKGARERQEMWEWARVVTFSTANVIAMHYRMWSNRMLVL